ncbi:MAG TPA: hypothetical protein VE866_15255 [Candidatus Binatia bacterium]|jgi:hypothetical protein|nr:hypothetical protein [Candidatus Binatia bacterium]
MTSAAQIEKSKSPLPAEIDDRAKAFHALEEELAAARQEAKVAQELLSAKELELIELVRECGGPHATKSKILHGIVWEMVATFSQYTTTDSAAVERFRQALIDAGQTRLMKKIFKADTRWTLQASSAEIVKSEKLSSKLMALLLQCSVTQDRKPTLDVRPKKKPPAAA